MSPEQPVAEIDFADNIIILKTCQDFFDKFPPQKFHRANTPFVTATVWSKSPLAFFTHRLYNRLLPKLELASENTP